MAQEKKVKIEKGSDLVKFLRSNSNLTSSSIYLGEKLSLTASVSQKNNIKFEASLSAHSDRIKKRYGAYKKQ